MKNYRLVWKSENHGMFWHDLYVYKVYKNKLIENILGFQEKNIKAFCSKGKYEFYLNPKEILRNKSKICNFYFSDNFNILKKKAYTILKWPIYFQYDYKSKNAVRRRLKKIINKYMEAVSLYCCTESYYVDLLVPDIDRNNLPQIVPKHMPSVIEEQLRWYELCLNEKTDINSIIKHCKKWKYIICSHQIEPYTTEILLKRYKNDTKNKEILNQNYKKLRNNNVLISYNETYSILSEIAYLRTELRLVWMHLGYIIKNIILQFYSNNPNIFDYTIDEILQHDYLRYQEDRKEFIYFSNGKKESLLYNGLMENNNEENIDCDKIKGSLSYGENVKGEAILLDKSLDVYSVDFENKILVVPQLTFELVPILGDVKGIVTDEGGITSHVNIIAREMNKPMLIGTFFATKIIKNGDLIEMDCKNSMVKRIFNLK